MAIRGGLSEFSVPELLQLLALQQKTGVLSLTHKQGHMHVLFFERGRLLAAADRRQGGRHEFLAYLLDNQQLGTDQVETVEDICRETGHDLFTVLMTSGVMSRDRLGEEMKRYTQRILDELVNWRDGTYDFSQGDEKSLPPMGLHLKLNPEELVLEAMRRGDELTTMKESMLAPDLLLARSDDPPSQPLPRECTVLLGMIDGLKTIEEIVRTSPLGEYLTYDSIAELLGRQQVMIVDPQDAHHFAKRRRTARISWSALLALISLLVGSGLLGAGAGPLLSRSAEGRGWLDEGVNERREAVRAQLEQDVARLRDIDGTR